MSLDEKLTRRGFLEAAGNALGKLGAGVAVASLPLSQAFAGDAKTANWNNPELEELRKAADAARDYAENNTGVGILIHVGQDIPNEHFSSAEQFGQVIVNVFRQNHGTDAQFFLRQNDAPATGVTYHIGHQIHGAEIGNEVKNVLEAFEAMPDVATQLKIVKELVSADPEAAVQEPS